MRNTMIPGAALLRMAMAALLALCAASAMAGAYTFSVVPQFPVVEVFRAWRPILDALEAETGHKFELKTFETIPKFEASFLAGEADFAYLNPYHAVMAKRAAGYIALLRGSERLSGILVVRADSPIRELGGLRGATIAYPAPNSFGASLYPRALLAERFKIATDAVYVKTHVNAYRAVIRGDNVAAGGIRATLEREPAEVRDQLRVLYETPATASHPVMAHPRVGAAVRAAVKAAMLKLDGTEAGRSMFKSVPMGALVEADYLLDFAPLETLRLERFIVPAN